MLQINNISITV